MNEERKGVVLYNLIFPIWMLILLPFSWLLVIPLNYCLDYYVVLFSLKKLGIESYKKKALKVSLKVCVSGFVADFAGAVLMIGVEFLCSPHSALPRWLLDFIYRWLVNPVTYNCWVTPLAVLYVAGCIFVSMVVIYKLNMSWGLEGIELDETQKEYIAKKLSLFTAPYFFLLPTPMSLYY